MNANEAIKGIKEFRKKNKKCLSTSHTFSFEELPFHTAMLAIEILHQKFSNFDVEFEELKITITIPV